MRKSALFSVISAAALILIHSVSSLASERTSADVFLAKAKATWQRLQSQSQNMTVPQLSAGQVAQIPMTALVPGQNLISVDNTLQKMQIKISEGTLTSSQANGGTWILPYNNGTSVVAEADPIEVVKGPMGYVIVDGHHDFFLSLYLDASTIAVHVQQDLSNLSPEQFWRQMQSKDLIFMDRGPKQLAKNPPTVTEITDSPNRYLAALLALKVSVLDRQILSQKGPKNAVWMKLNNSIAFIEFHIARVLENAGIIYDPEWGSQVPDAVVEKARTVLAQEATKPRSLISQIPIFKNAQIAARAATQPEVLLQFATGPASRMCSEILLR